MSRHSKMEPLLRHLQKLWPHMPKDRLYAAVLCANVKVNGEVCRNPQAMVSPESDFILEESRFVSRGGLKLDGVLEEFDFDPQGKICLDAGASTGGFTDCLLQRGATHVHAVDVGFNQLAWKLRSDPRVTVHEKTNLMQISPDILTPCPQMAVADLSFRSLRGAASQLLNITRGGLVLALLKPQFEHPRESDFTGVVRTEEARKKVLYTLIRRLEEEQVFVIDAFASPLTGRRGNAEIFVLLSRKVAFDSNHLARRIHMALEFASSNYSKSSRDKGVPTQNPSPPR